MTEERSPRAGAVDRRRWQRRIDQALSRDRGTLMRLLAAAVDDPRRIGELAAAVAASEAAVAARAARIPPLHYDSALPITRQRPTLLDAIRRHPVLIVQGETGSGKTTQLPKLCLEAGCGRRGAIGVTQPRRLAARSIALRVARELGDELGALVGYEVRFHQESSPEVLIKFMTDGILLAEIAADRSLRQYDTLIIDEAHERSLNIDFLLGYLHRLRRRRPDLKLIVASATIDAERFARYFDDAPILSIEGRGHPVEIRYRPPEPDDTGSAEPWQGLIAALEELGGEDPRGDILVFLPGEREIREVHRLLAKQRWSQTEILPLYARLSLKDQARVFEPGPARRIVLATNVAETSLTVPRVRFVVDTGLARLARYSPRARVQRLVLEPIARANADQRAGRCGRTAPGICIRLYADEDYARRPPHTEPEILRAQLAGVILRMLRLELGDPRQFPFLESPGERALNEGYQLLRELGAIDAERRLTRIGRIMAEFPLDVRLARMLIAAQEGGGLSEVLAIVAGLSIQDPRERPYESRAAAEAAHAMFAEPNSDFLGWWRLWEAFDHQHRVLTQAALRTWAKEHFLSYPRLREWRDLHRQLLLIAQKLGWRIDHPPADSATIHRAILSGLATQVAEKTDRGEYRATRGRRFKPFPASALAARAPRWVMFLGLLELRTVYAVQLARIEPAWIEPWVRHLARSTLHEPHWDAERGHAMAYEDVDLYGLRIVTRRPVALAPRDPEQARALLIRHGLVGGALRLSHPLLVHNRAILAAAREREERRRRRGLVQSEAALCAWFAERLPEAITSAAALDRWLRADPGHAARLKLELADVLVADEASDAEDFPSVWSVGGQDLALSYRFEPGAADDGLTVDVPLAQLPNLDLARLTWLVPGLRWEKATWLLKSLPKTWRRHVVPAPDFARAFLEAHPSGSEDFVVTLRRFIERITGVSIPAEAWDLAGLPPHLVARVRVRDEAGRILAEGRDVEALRATFAAAALEAFARRLDGELHRDGLHAWPGTLPEQVQDATGLTAFPALVDQGDAVGVRAFPDPAAAAAAHAAGVLRLLRLELAEGLRYHLRHLGLSPKARLYYAVRGSVDALGESLLTALLERALPGADRIRSAAAFQALRDRVAAQLGPQLAELCAQLEPILLAYGTLRQRLSPPLIGYAAANLDDLRAQLDGLIGPELVARWGIDRLADLQRYLHAAEVRLERLTRDPVRDQTRMLDVLPFVRRLAELEREHPTAGAPLRRLRYAVEEFRVSLFAQELGTAEKISAKRLERLFQASVSELTRSG